MLAAWLSENMRVNLANPVAVVRYPNGPKLVISYKNTKILESVKDREIKQIGL